MFFKPEKEIHVEAGALSTASMTETQSFVISAGVGGIVNYARWGNDLVVELSSGRSLRINNFFINGPAFHKLLLVDGNARVEVDFSQAMTNSGDGIAEEAVHYQKIADPVSTKTLLAILGGGAAIAGGAVALAGSGGSDGSSGHSAARPGMVIVIKDDQEPGVGAIENGGATNDTTPMLEGSRALPGATITIRLKGFDPITVKADGNGMWKYTFPELADGNYEAVVVETDGSGRVIGESIIKFTVDTVAPDSPLLEKVEDNVTPVVGEVKDGDFTNDPRPAFSGTAEAGALIRIYDGDKLIGSVLADKNGKWSFELKEGLKDGAHELHFTATDLAGNESEPSPVFHITVDTVPPALLDMRGIELRDETGAVIKDGATTANSDLTFTGRVGSVEARWIEIIGNDGQVAARIEVAADGSWSWSFGSEGLKLGWQTFQFRAVDAAGNLGALTRLFSFEYREETPAPPPGEAEDGTPDDAAAVFAQGLHGHGGPSSAHVDYGALQGRFASVHRAGVDEVLAGRDDDMAGPALSHGVADSAPADHPGIADLFFAGNTGGGGQPAHMLEMLLAEGLPLVHDDPDMDAVAACQQVIV